jgi:hypothetical protein
VASDSAHITSGVSQGSVLGPFLFYLFMIDMTFMTTYMLIMFSFTFRVNDVMGDCVARLNNDLDHIHRWSMSNGFLLTV